MKILKICGFAAAMWLCAAGMAFGQNEIGGLLFSDNLETASVEVVSDSLAHRLCGTKSESLAVESHPLQAHETPAPKAKTKMRGGAFARFWRAIQWTEAIDQF